MKLAAIYNAFDGLELLEGSIKQLYDHVDLIVIVYQLTSNFGELYHPVSEATEIYQRLNKLDKVELVHFEHDPDSEGFTNETEKRNQGIDFARENHCTHFFHIDCDEYYEDFGAAKKAYIKSGASGSVCNIITYFKKPTLQFDSIDGYYVPFIHELNETTISGRSSYPFYTDPTRVVNESDVVLLPVVMQHYSWVRKDIERKCRNSSARYNIKKGTMLQDYNSAEVAPGFYVKDYDKKLVEVHDKFGIGKMI